MNLYPLFRSDLWRVLFAIIFLVPGPQSHSLRALEHWNQTKMRFRIELIHIQRENTQFCSILNILFNVQSFSTPSISIFLLITNFFELLLVHWHFFYRLHSRIIERVPVEDALCSLPIKYNQVNNYKYLWNHLFLLISM